VRTFEWHFDLTLRLLSLTCSAPQHKPRQAANTDPAITPSFAAPNRLSSSKASRAIKMDIVNDAGQTADQE
jgi:hypothetical protein